MLVCLDAHAEVRDFYFPYVGLENHIGGHYVHRVGVWTEGKMRWFDHPSWHITVGSRDRSFVGDTYAINDELGLQMHLSDIVYNEKNIFLRRVSVKNILPRSREVKIYFGQEFEIYESHRGDTAYFDPISDSIIHYNGRRVFLVRGLYKNKNFDDYTTGIFNIEGKEGSYVDAEDGLLSKNPIEHGYADSVIGFTLQIGGDGEESLYYWIAAGETIKETHELNEYLILKTPDHLMKSTNDFWNAWLNKNHFSFNCLDDKIVTLFGQSLFVIRAHFDNHGAVIASSDSDMLQRGRDTYSYMWPRDASFSAMALDMTGNSSISRRFFEFSNEVVSDEGYFMHKYRSDKSLGSSWHPWVRNGEFHLPIQEDETALTIYALLEHYRASQDLEFIESLYNSLIKKTAMFMVEYRDDLGLPKPSYDLWEEKYGITTFTSCAVYGALNAAAKFARMLGKQRGGNNYASAADEIKNAILKYLYDEQTGNFYKMINFANRGIVYDKTIDMSSFYGLFAFGVLDINDQRLERFSQNIVDRISPRSPVGGIARYKGDLYYRKNSDIPGNPWVITTLWFAQYLIAKAKNVDDLDAVKTWLTWASKYAMPSGTLPEQIDPFTGEQLSATPLTWSHAEFVITVVKYMDKLEEMGICNKVIPSGTL